MCFVGGMQKDDGLNDSDAVMVMLSNAVAYSTIRGVGEFTFYFNSNISNASLRTYFRTYNKF